MLRKHTRPSIVVLLTAALVLGWSPTAHADQVFHTTQYPLSSVADGSVHGWVIDVHTQGPSIYAQERYLLRDVSPGQTYLMNLYAYSDPACSDLVVTVPGTATMTANAAGNAHGATTLSPLRWKACLERRTTCAGRSRTVPTPSSTRPRAWPWRSTEARRRTSPHREPLDAVDARGALRVVTSFQGAIGERSS